MEKTEVELLQERLDPKAEQIVIEEAGDGLVVHITEALSLDDSGLRAIQRILNETGKEVVFEADL